MFKAEDEEALSTGEVDEELPVVENVAADSVLIGAEAPADIKLTGALTAEVTYDWVRGELKDSGEPLPRIPPHRLPGGLRYPRIALQIGGSLQAVSTQDARVRRGVADRRLLDGQVLRFLFV